MDFLYSIDIGSLVTTYVILWAIRIVSVLAIYAIGRWIIRLVVRVPGKALTRSGVDTTLSKFLGNIVYATIMKTGDNREFIVSNGAIYGSIIDYTARATRRIDLVMGHRLQRHEAGQTDHGRYHG